MTAECGSEGENQRGSDLPSVPEILASMSQASPKQNELNDFLPPPGILPGSGQLAQISDVEGGISSPWPPAWSLTNRISSQMSEARVPTLEIQIQVSKAQSKVYKARCPKPKFYCVKVSKPSFEAPLLSTSFLAKNVEQNQSKCWQAPIQKRTSPKRCFKP